MVHSYMSALPGCSGGREVMGCGNDVRSPSATPVSSGLGGELTWEFSISFQRVERRSRPLLLLRNGAEGVLGVSPEQRGENEGRPNNLMDDGMGEQLVLWAGAPRGDNLESDDAPVLSLVELRRNPGSVWQVTDNGDEAGSGTPRAGGGGPGEPRREPADLRVASGLQGCRSRCCPPSPWPSSV